MPYAPGVSYDASPIFNGITHAGNAFLQRRKLEEKAQQDAQDLLLQRSKLDQDQSYRYDKMAQDLAINNLDAEIKLKGLDDEYNYRAKRHAPPSVIKIPGVGKVLSNPLTGQATILKDPVPRSAEPKVMKKDGKTYIQNERTGDWKHVPEKSVSPLDTLLALPSGAGQGTGGPAVPPVSGPGSGQGPAHVPGKVYPGENGSAARYNADGTWTRVR